MSALPTYLNQFQALAWVRYRTREAVDAITTWDAVTAEKWFGERALIASLNELERELKAGKIKAHGGERGKGFSEIPAIEWQVLALAPLDPARHDPYRDVLLSGADLERRWPAQKARNSQFDWLRAEEWFEEIMAAESRPSINELYLDLAVRFGRNPPSESSIKRHIRRWLDDKGFSK